MSKMHYYIAAPIFLLALLVQTTLLWRLSADNFSPNLLLCFTVVFSFLYNERFGLVLGVVSGMLLDIATSPVFGVQALSFVIVFIMIRYFRLILNNEKLIPDMFMGILATPINAFFVWGVCRLAGSQVDVKFVFDKLPALFISQCILVGLLHLIFVRTVIRHRRDRKFESEFEL
jgi:rod shape-determining protein MreD